MAKAVIYTTRFCPFCMRAMQLLTAKKAECEEHPVDGNAQMRRDLLARTGSRTVPQIWIGDTYVGGCDELFALEREGRLDALLKA